MDRAFQRIRSLMLRGTFYSVPPKTIKQTSRILKIMNIVISIIHTKANNKFVS